MGYKGFFEDAIIGDYITSQRRLRTRDVLRWPGYQAAINSGLVLFCVGLIGSAQGVLLYSVTQ